MWRRAARPRLPGLDVAGINIEDSTAERLVPPGRHAAKLAAIKRQSPRLFVNARIDTYWLDQDADLEPTLTRARVYVDAGADGIFVPGATDAQVLRELAARIDVPLNTLLVPGLSVAELGELGVRRVSTGSALRDEIKRNQANSVDAKNWLGIEIIGAT